MQEYPHFPRRHELCQKLCSYWYYQENTKCLKISKHFYQNLITDIQEKWTTGSDSSTEEYCILIISSEQKNDCYHKEDKISLAIDVLLQLEVYIAKKIITL